MTLKKSIDCPMKKIVSLLGIFALCAASFTACNKVTENDIQEKGKHIIKVTPVMAETRTVLDESGNTISVKWADSDVEIDPEGNTKFHVWENRVKGLAEATLNQDNTIATITCAFDENTSTNLVYSSCFAKQLDDNGNPVILEFQNPGSSSFDPDADLLIGEDITKTSQPDELLVNFSRPVALVKMTLKGLEVGESVTSVFVTSKSGKMTGVYNRANGAFDFTNGEKTIVVCPTGVTVGSDGTAPVYFVSAPIENEILEIEVWTSKGGAESGEEYHYKKEFAKGISFPANKLTRFTANLTGCEVVTPVDKFYVKVTSDEDIVPGEYLIVYESLNADVEDEAEILSGVVNDLGTVAVSPIITDGGFMKIAQTGNEAYNIVVEEGTTGYTLKLGNSYLKYNGSSNNLYLAESATADGTEWTLSVDGITNVNTERKLQYNYNNGNPRFACYKGTMQDVSLYFLEGSESSGKQPVTMSFNPASVELTFGESFTAPVLTTNPAGLSVKYSSSDPDVASVNENSGEVTIVADGSATITATFPGNAEYKPGSAYYTITVNPAPMTLPFTESFTEAGGVMGWSGSAAQGDIAYDNEGWEAENAYGAGGTARFGKSSNGLGKATTPEIHYSGNATLTFKAGAWNYNTESTNLKLSVSSGTIYSDASLTTSVSSVTLAKGAWTEYTLYLKDLVNPFTVTFEGNSENHSRFFLDDISIVEGIEQPAPAFGASISNTENVSAAGGTKVVNVSGNVSWTAAATNGATVSPASGTGVGVVTVTIPANTSVENTVSYVVTVSTTAEVSPNSYEFTITQDAASGAVNTSTEDNPYTPSEAYELADLLDGSTTLSDVYVYGIISQITSEYNADFHNVTFNISADGLTTGTQFTLFRVPANSASDYQVGDAVEFKGTLKNYGGDTPELTETFTKIYQYKAPTFSPDGGVFSGSQNVTITADEGVTIRYTLDGSNPTATTGTVYESAISISEATTIKAIGTKNGIVTGIVSAMFTKSTGGGSYSLTPDQASTGSNATTYITSLTEFTYEGISWKMNQWNPSTLQIKTNQSSATSEFRFYNTSAFSGRIAKVVITFSALTVADASKLMFKGGTSAVSSTSGGTAGTWDSAKKTLTWIPAAGENFTYFAFYQDGKAATGTNKLAEADAIVVTYE